MTSTTIDHSFGRRSVRVAPGQERTTKRIGFRRSLVLLLLLLVLLLRKRLCP
jgi:hypothetical protein